RPDPVFTLEQAGLVDYLGTLEAAADVSITRVDDLRQALTRRLDHFAACGCRASDHCIETLRYAPVPDDAQLDAILGK
ncbi:glucuronate isomerase, partial [Salmonella enterica subsp. enterica serovar Infantis]